MPSRLFTCCACLGRFETVVSDEDAAAEMEQRLGLSEDDVAVSEVCTACYERLVAQHQDAIAPEPAQGLH